MQKVIYKCDTCDKEIPAHFVVKLAVSGGNVVQVSYEMCSDCWFKIQNEIIWIVRRTK